MTEPMTDTERIAMIGLSAREREALTPIQRDLATLCRAVEERLDLPPGSIGTTHVLDTDTWEVRPIPAAKEPD